MRLQLSGFTLLEVVVVLLIITIILGMVGVNLTRNPADTLREEADRLALVLQNAQQQAILEGRPYGFSFTEKDYQFFVRLDSSKHPVPITDDALLAPRELPPTMTLTPAETDKENPKANDVKELFDPIVFDPSGESPVFNFTLSSGDLYWYVRGQSDGQVISSPFAEPTKG